MATPISSNDALHTNTDDKPLEMFSIIWLDANVNVKETRDTEQKLRSIINHLKKFQDVKQCQEYIERRSQKDRLILIVSGQFGREIVPSIFKRQHVISIYVYCMDTTDNEQWASEFSKVKGVIMEPDELISRITADHKIQKKLEEPLSIINVFTTNVGGGKGTTAINGRFVFSQNLIDCLLRLKSTQTDKNELINICKNEYEGNSIESNNLRKFEKDYSSDQVLRWYTKESFFYKTLNAALRNQDINMIFLYRSFISDIHDELHKYQSQDRLRVYRSSLMSGDELSDLKGCIGRFISVNSFFSTSKMRDRALFFLGDTSTPIDSERVLFEIDADPKMVVTKPFADISGHSEFVDELEVLFMLGSIFRLKSINPNDDQIWIIQMTLCSDDEHDLEQVLRRMKQQTGDGETNLQTLGKVLWKMGKFDLAEKYFKRFLNELPSNDPLHATLYEDLGELASQKGDFDMSVQWHQQLLEFQSQNQLTVNPDNNETNNSIGESVSAQIGVKKKWGQYGYTIAGRDGRGSGLNQLNCPYGIDIHDDERSIYIADFYNHRIIKWNYNKNIGQVAAGGNGPGNQMNQLDTPTDVIMDIKNDSIIICDHGNRRVVRWSRQNGTANGEIIISDIDCYGLTMDNNGDLYVSDWTKSEVRRWKIGDTNGTIVAGGNGTGNYLNQLDSPRFIFVDQDRSVYVTDRDNHRVMKWMSGAEEGIIVAGGEGKGNSLRQLSYPQGVIVDRLDNVYVTDSHNDRVLCWSKGSKEGSIVVGESGKGKLSNNFTGLRDLSFDRQGDLYVVDYCNHRVQKFHITSN